MNAQDPRPSLAELRALSASRRKGYENQAAAGIADTAFGSTVEIPADTFDALLDIAAAAHAIEDERLCLEKRLYCDCGCFDAARAARPVLRESLAKVRP